MKTVNLKTLLRGAAVALLFVASVTSSSASAPVASASPADTTLEEAVQLAAHLRAKDIQPTEAQLEERHVAAPGPSKADLEKALQDLELEEKKFQSEFDKKDKDLHKAWAAENRRFAGNYASHHPENAAAQAEAQPASLEEKAALQRMAEIEAESEKMWAEWPQQRAAYRAKIQQIQAALAQAK